MEVIREIAAFKARRASWERPIGVVPTMGFLHEGHMELVRWARRENPTVVTTIFVNPTQFGPTEDFGRYPKALEKDLDMLRRGGVDAVFAPSPAEMYPPDFSSWVDVEEVTSRLEGESRPGHFRGVATVCNKLFNVSGADRAYFGQKDGQQVAVIRRMVHDLNMNLEIVVVPTVREADGLAMSSRNSYLNEVQRKAATVLYRALIAARDVRLEGGTDSTAVRRKMVDVIASEPLAVLDYADVVDPSTFKPMDSLEYPGLAVLAVRIGDTRLIDNMLLA